jgi:hypothetical protein
MKRESPTSISGRGSTSMCFESIVADESAAVFDTHAIKVEINKFGEFSDNDLVDIVIDEIVRKVDRNFEVNEKMLRYLVIGLYSIKDEIVRKLKYL